MTMLYISMNNIKPEKIAQFGWVVLISIKEHT